MQSLKKRWWIFLILSAICSLAIPIIDKSLPIVRDIECHRSFFPTKRFQERLQKPAAPWMLTQLKKDFSPFEKNRIHQEFVKKTFARIYQKLGYLPEINHFRILNNKLYKFVPDGAPFSCRDTLTEKMLKTLLMQVKTPDCDFILCGMDGVPEPYVPSDFYLTENPIDQAPILAQARRESIASQYIILIPDQLCLSKFWYDDAEEILQANKTICWEEKQEKALWRGGLSDSGEPNDGRFVAHYHTTPRFQLCQTAKKHPELVDAGLANLDSKQMEALAKELGLWSKPLSKTAHLSYKYLPVLDGHMCTYPGYQWRLLSNSVCFKQESDQVQWFYSALQPYVHYVPIKNDMSDLLEQIEWAQKHDEEAKTIAANSTAFVMQNLLFEDMYFYLHLTFLEYAKHQSIDFKELKKETRQDPRWKCIQYRKRLSLKKSFDRVQSSLSFYFSNLLRFLSISPKDSNEN